MKQAGPQLFFSHRLTTALLITVVSAVIMAVAYRPQGHAAVVGLTVKICVIVTSICWSHYGEKRCTLD